MRAGTPVVSRETFCQWHLKLAGQLLAVGLTAGQVHTAWPASYWPEAWAGGCYRVRVAHVLSYRLEDIGEVDGTSWGHLDKSGSRDEEKILNCKGGSL